MSDTILKETINYLFKQTKVESVKIKKAFLDIYTTVQLENNDVGTCICHGGWGKYRGTVLSNLKFNRDFNIEENRRKYIPCLESEYIRSLYVAICSAMSRRLLLDLVKEQNIYTMPKLNRKSDIVVQIGFIQLGFINYKILKKIYVFDKDIFNLDRIEHAKREYERIKKTNRNLSFIFMDKLANRQRVLEEADILMITGSTLTNGTLDEILKTAKKAKEVVIWGRSCAIHPEVLFKNNVAYIYSTIPPLNLMKVATTDYKLYISVGEPGRRFILKRRFSKQ